MFCKALSNPASVGCLTVLTKSVILNPGEIGAPSICSSIVNIRAPISDGTLVTELAIVLPVFLSVDEPLTPTALGAPAKSEDTCFTALLIVSRDEVADI
jgi:hypothetical protein